MGHITQDHLQQSAIAIPDNKDIADRFEELISPIFNQIIKLHEEILNLTKQRDKLLPLLMNGQVSVNSLIYRFSINLIIRTTTRICSYPNDLFWSYLRIVFLLRITGNLHCVHQAPPVYMPLFLLHPACVHPNEGLSRKLPPPPPEETGIGCPLMSASATAKIILRTEGIASWPSNVFSSDSIFSFVSERIFILPSQLIQFLRNLPGHCVGRLRPVGCIISV